MNLLASAVLMFALLQQFPKQVPANFTGLFRGIESGKQLVIEMDGHQDLRMFIIGSTKFVRDGKPAKSSQFNDGDTVAVEAERDARMNLVALKVEAVKPKPPEKTE